MYLYMYTTQNVFRGLRAKSCKIWNCLSPTAFLLDTLIIVKNCTEILFYFFFFFNDIMFHWYAWTNAVTAVNETFSFSFVCQRYRPSECKSNNFSKITNEKYLKKTQITLRPEKKTSEPITASRRYRFVFKRKSLQARTGPRRAENFVRIPWGVRYIA